MQIYHSKFNKYITTYLNNSTSYSTCLLLMKQLLWNGGKLSFNSSTCAMQNLF
jgi:hypothetical protein